MAQSKPAGQLERQEFSLFRPNTAEFCVKKHWNSSCVCKNCRYFLCFQIYLKMQKRRIRRQQWRKQKFNLPRRRPRPFRPAAAPVGFGCGRLRQNAGAGGTCGGADHRPGPSGGCRFSVDHDIYQCGSGQAAGGYYQAPGSRDSPASTGCAPAPPADAAAAGIHRHSGCVLPAFCAAELFRLWMFRRILPLRMTLPWCACSRKPFPPCWNRHIPILTSVPLRTCGDRGRTDDTTGRAVQELYHFTQALPHPAQALQRFVEMWQSDAPPEKTQWGQAVLRETSARIKGVLRLLRTAQKIAAKDPAADKALTAVLMDDEDRMLLVLDRLDHGAWDTVPEALDNADNWRRAGRVPGGIASNIAAMSANMLRDRAKKQIATLRTDFLLCPAADYQADRRRAAPLVAALVRAVEQYRRTLLEAKLAEKSAGLCRPGAHDAGTAADTGVRAHQPVPHRQRAVLCCAGGRIPGYQRAAGCHLLCPCRAGCF